jgi:hypothetical protein
MSNEIKRGFAGLEAKVSKLDDGNTDPSKVIIEVRPIAAGNTQKPSRQINTSKAVTADPSAVTPIATGADMTGSIGLFFVEAQRNMALRPGAPKSIRKNWEILEWWIGCAGRPLNEIDKEKVKRGWKAYVAYSAAPTRDLNEAFDQMSRLTKAEETDLPPKAVIEVFGRMLGSSSKIAGFTNESAKPVGRIKTSMSRKELVNIWISVFALTLLVMSVFVMMIIR